MANEHKIGTRVKLTVTFTLKSTGALTDTTASIFVKDGDGAEVEYDSPTNESTGVYTQEIDVTAHTDTSKVATWSYRGKGTVTIVATDEDFFTVPASAFTTL